MKSEFLRIAEAILEAERRPMSALEIVNLGHERRLFSDRLSGKTPHQTMKAKLSVHIRRHGHLSPFVRTKPGRFFLGRLLQDPHRAYQARRAQPPHGSERVLVFPAEWLDSLHRFQGITKAWRGVSRKLFQSDVWHYVERLQAEQDETSKQILTYIIVTKGSQILAYRRGTYSRVEDFLKGAHCIGFGGHVTETDLTLFNRADLGLLASAARELSEELSLPRADQERLRRHEGLTIVGLINDDSSAVGRRHFAFVLRYEVNNESFWDRPRRGEKSITQLRWIDPTSEGISLNDFEYWSQLCFRQFFPASVRTQSSFLLRRRAPLLPPHLLCVVGTLGSGKSEATRVLTEDFGYREVNTGRVLAALLRRAPVNESDRESFQAAAWRFISKPDGPRRLAGAIWKHVQRLSGPRLLVDGIRQRATLNELRLLATPMLVGVLFVHTPPDVAYNFYRSRSPRPFSIHDFLRVRDSPVEQEVERLLALSDAVLYNWEGRHMYQQAVRELMREVGVGP